jgi:pilus assembly protein CpaB
MLLQVASRPLDTDPSFVVGSDVSRFQRKSMPARPQPVEQTNNQAPVVVAAPPRPVPTVRIARGNTVTEVPVGGK